MFLSFTPSKKVSLQIKTTKEVENVQCFSRVTARGRYYKKKANRQDNI